MLNDGTGLYRLGSTIPVKFQLTDASGAVVSGAVATLSVAKVSDAPSGSVPVDAVASGAANADALFRYDALAQQYVYNLSTKLTGLGVGTWTLRASLDDGSTRSVDVSLR